MSLSGKRQSTAWEGGLISEIPKKTMDNTFIESVWWALGELQKKDLLYEGVRILAYCPRCETPIANSEIAMDNSYKDISDISVYVKFELEDDPSASSRQGRTYLLAWTTT